MKTKKKTKRTHAKKPRFSATLWSTDGKTVKFRVDAMPDEWRELGILFRASNGIEIASYADPELDKGVIYLRGNSREKDRYVHIFDAGSQYACRWRKALTEFTAWVEGCYKPQSDPKPEPFRYTFEA